MVSQSKDAPAAACAHLIEVNVSGTAQGSQEAIHSSGVHELGLDLSRKDETLTYPSAYHWKSDKGRRCSIPLGCATLLLSRDIVEAI